MTRGSQPTSPHRPAKVSTRVSSALLAVAAIVAIVLVSTITFVVLQRSQPASTSRADSTATSATGGSAAPPAAIATSTSTAVVPALVPASSIDQVLLTPDELNSILGTYASSGGGRVGLMKVNRSTYGMSDNSNLIKPPSCVGVVFGAEHEVYGNTNFSAMRDQTFTPEPYAYDPTRSAPGALEQTVVAFPSIDQARTVIASAQNEWSTCASAEVNQFLPPEDGYDWKLGSVERQGDLLTVSMASNGTILGPRACQQVLGVRKNIVVGTRSCNDVGQSFSTNYDQARNSWPTDPNWATNDSEHLATAMLNKIAN